MKPSFIHQVRLKTFVYVAGVLLSLSSTVADAGQWVIVPGPGETGGLSGSSGDLADPDIVSRANGELFAVWLEKPTGVHVKYFDGENWTEYGAGSASGFGVAPASTDPYKHPEIALDASQEPMVAFGVRHTSYLRRWDGNSWTNLGVSDTGDGIGVNLPTHSFISGPELETDAAGNPTVTWSAADSNSQYINVSRWNGSTWIKFKQGDLYPSMTNVNNSFPALVLTSTGNAVIAHQHREGVSWLESTPIDTYVTRWNGSGWTGYGGSNSGTGISDPDPLIDDFNYKVALDPSDFPFVSSLETHNNGGVPDTTRFRRWDGSVWVDVDHGGVVPGQFVVNDMKTDPLGRIVVAGFVDDVGPDNDTTQVYRWNGVSWEFLGSIPEASHNPDHPTIKLAIGVLDEIFIIFDSVVQETKDVYVFKYVESDLQSNRTYIYDELDRLTNINTDNGIRIRYDYDSAGNRTQKEVTSQLVIQPTIQDLQNFGVSNNAANEPVFRLLLDVNPEEDLTLDTVAFQTAGSGNESAGISNAKLWSDDNKNGIVDGGDVQIGSTVSTFQNDGVIVFDGINATLSKGDIIHVLVSYTFNGAPSVGDTFQLNLSNRRRIAATGATSGKSIYVLGTPVVGPFVTVTNDFVPPSFSGLDTAADQPTVVQLDWTPAFDAAGSLPITYRIWQSTSSFGGSVSGASDYSTTNTSLLITGLTNGQTYYFVVRAEDGVGNRETNAVERSATPQAVTYSLAVNAVNGSAFPLPPDGVYEDGTDVSLIPNPDEGFAFAGWTGDVPGGQELDDPLILTMDADKSVTANFSLAVGTVQVDTTPDDAQWSFVDGLGNMHNGVGDDTLSPIPTGGVEVTWQNRSGYLLPPLNPAVEVVPAGGTVALMGEYVLPISFDTHPQSLKRYVGESASFSVAASGGLGTAQYTWKFDDGVNPAEEVGGNSTSYSIPFVTLAGSGSYHCEVKDDYPAVYQSATATLQTGTHLSITSHPQDATKNEEQSHTFSVAAAGGIGNTSYVWQKGANVIPSETGSSYTIPFLTLDDAGSYTVTVSDEHTDVLVTNAAVLTVEEGVLPLGTSKYSLLQLFLLLTSIIFISALVLRSLISKGSSS